MNWLKQSFCSHVEWTETSHVYSKSGGPTFIAPPWAITIFYLSCAACGKKKKIRLTGWWGSPSRTGEG